MPSEIEKEAPRFIASGDLGLTGVIIAHLRVSRFELLQWSDMTDPDMAMHLAVKLLVDKAMTALITTTYPVHEWDRRTK